MSDIIYDNSDSSRTENGTLTAGASTPFSLGMGRPVKDHAFEIEMTDDNASITALAIDFYFTITSIDGVANPTAANNLFLKRTHTFTSSQLSDLKHMVVINDQPAKAVAVGINAVTGEEAADIVKIKYHALDRQ